MPGVGAKVWVMNSQTAPTGTGVPPAFLDRCGDSITGVLSGFDRLRLRGTLRHLFQPTVMEADLNACRILIKDFGTFAEGLTARIKAAAYASAARAGRPLRYLASSQISKEALARQIAREDGVAASLVALFSATENCPSYSGRGNRQTKHIHLVLEPRRCNHLYHYFLHAELGLGHVRVQAWFPFTVDLCLNGRDRLAWQMDQAGRAYRQRANCFIWVQDAGRAQALQDEQLRTDWPGVLTACSTTTRPSRNRRRRAKPGCLCRRRTLHPQFPGRAKHIIHIYLNGGPPRLDTFDPKPALRRLARQLGRFTGFSCATFAARASRSLGFRSHFHG